LRTFVNGLGLNPRSAFSTAAILLIALFSASCDSDSRKAVVPVVPAFPTVAKFVVSIDGSGVGSNVNVFPVNATTGALGAAVAGSPFDMGLTNGMTLEVHPNGHFVYAADSLDGSIHAWDVSETTGVPTAIAAPMINESGTFYQPCCGAGDAATHVITVTPDGKYLYSSNNDATVGAYSIGSTGAPTHIADVDLSACDTGAISANNSFVWVTDTCGGFTGPWNVMTMTIGAGGGLTKTSSIALTGVDAWLWSIQVNPVANFLYVGDEGGGAQLYSFSVATDGSLTQLGPQLVENASSDVRNIAHSPDGKFFYTTDDEDVVHAFSVNTTTGAITELLASPYPGAAGQIVVDVTGQFVYFGGGTIFGFTRDTTTGALTLVGNTVTANDAALAVGIVR
jgi:6-phosphogluconolactonase (cycloisomerase 2 family)